MTDTIKSLPFGTCDPGDDIIRVSLDMVSLSSVAADSLVSKYTAFPKAFGSTPKVIGMNLVSGATLAALSAKATAAGVTFYIRGIVDNDLDDGGTVVVEATLRGALA